MTTREAMRAEALAARDQLENRGALSSAAVLNFGRWLSQTAPGAPLAGYWPIRGEADPRAVLAAHSGPTCMPVVVGHGQPLAFRAWSLGQQMQPGPFGTFHPVESAESAQPSVVMVPLAGFDRAGNRLGYGGGYYDRTLAKLRASGRVIAAGFAFGAQELPEIAAEPHDQPLDLIVTDAEIIFPRRDG